jgi:hypothetical protein
MIVLLLLLLLLLLMRSIFGLVSPSVHGLVENFRWLGEPEGVAIGAAGSLRLMLVMR